MGAGGSRISLAHQMILRLGLAGVVIVLAVTGALLALDYQLARARAGERLVQVEKSYLPGIAENVWLDDRERLGLLVMGIDSLPAVSLVEVRDPGGAPLATAGATPAVDALERVYPLVRTYLGQQRDIGTLRVVIGRDELTRPVLQRAWMVLLASLVLVGGLLTVLFHLVAPLVTRPLEEMAAYARSLAAADLTNPPALERGRGGGDDEFADLAIAFGEMRRAIRLSYQALQDSEARHRMLFTASPVSLWEEDFSAVKTMLDQARPIIGADLDAYLAANPAFADAAAARVRVIDVNTATLALHRAPDREALLGALDRTFTPGSRDAFRRQLLAIWHGERELSVEGEVRALDGERRDVVVHWVVPEGHGATLDRVIVALEDITDRRAMEQSLAMAVKELQQSNRELERFHFAAFHDLQEPVRGIVSFAQLLRRHLHGTIDAETEEFLRYLVAAAERMQGQVEGLQGYARAGTDARPLMPVDMEALLAEVRAALADIILRSHAEVESGPLPAVRGDREQLADLLRQLLGNALKFARPGAPPRVRVTARDDGDTVLFVVEDDGIGVDPVFKDEIFQMFKRLHGPDRYPGAGIGLAICRRIVARHGGRIWVEPRPEGGSRFCFTLPAADAENPGDAGAPRGF
ncbi:ATP-binding protein [Magnetospirillum sp. UT-4]|uniref:ATP-binding protein n=1 Tax=Magnetospirillum sp. UT-4 TaxID=2681467 RepID=UPI0020C4B8E6|nr:ATP-binding protein [Magnetospirillum sp. UT-4]